MPEPEPNQVCTVSARIRVQDVAKEAFLGQVRVEMVKALEREGCHPPYEFYAPALDGGTYLLKVEGWRHV